LEKIVTDWKKFGVAMTQLDVSDLFTQEKVEALFPATKTDDFFEALYGDASEGAYDIKLKFDRQEDSQLMFEFHLTKREDKCLVCSLTYGLPEVFSRHPVINLKGIAQNIDELLGDEAGCTDWKIGATRSVSSELHTIPVTFNIEPA